MAIELTKEELFELFHYDDGKLFWKVSNSNRVKVGDEAGCVNKVAGYKYLMINGKNHIAHRIIAKMFLEYWNEFLQVDHINHNRLDNRLINLRMVTRSDNLRNSSKYSNNTSGYHGIRLDKQCNKWQVRCVVNRKEIYGGRYKTLEEAIVARDALYKKHDFHPNHGKQIHFSH